MFKIEWMPALVAGTMCLGFFAVLGVMLFHSIPQANLSTVNIIIGAVGGSVTTIVAFYFGSSKSSQAKDETLQEIAKAP